LPPVLTHQISFSWNAPLQRSSATLEETALTLWNPELRHRIEERAYALWEANGRPEGRDLDYWLQAEQEIVNYSMAGE
jgi:hypothetical protein